jgi:hypothetical protein
MTILISMPTPYYSRARKQRHIRGIDLLCFEKTGAGAFARIDADLDRTAAFWTPAFIMVAGPVDIDPVVNAAAIKLDS